MIHKTAILNIRRLLGVPVLGFSNQMQAMEWFRKHYKTHRGKNWEGSFGFNYYPERGLLEYQYELGKKNISFNFPEPIDREIPLDRETIKLARQEGIPVCYAPAFRLVILIGLPPDEFNLLIPDKLMGTIGDCSFVFNCSNVESLRSWRAVGEMLGLLYSRNRITKTPGITTTYYEARKNKKLLLYFQTLMVYIDALYNRQTNNTFGRYGLLKDTAKILSDQYGWDQEPDTYTVRRYLDRARSHWRLDIVDNMELSNFVKQKTKEVPSDD